MVWLLALALGGVLLAMVAVTWLWRRVRRLEKKLDEKNNAQEPLGRDALNSMELTLGAMLEELDAKNKEILAELDQRFQQAISLSLESPNRETPEYPNGNPSQPTQTLSTARPQEPQERSYQDKVEVVHQLAAQGHDVLTIAQRLGLGKGEVQLILELRRQRA